MNQNDKLELGWNNQNQMELAFPAPNHHAEPNRRRDQRGSRAKAHFVTAILVGILFICLGTNTDPIKNLRKTPSRSTDMNPHIVNADANAHKAKSVESQTTEQANVEASGVSQRGGREETIHQNERKRGNNTIRPIAVTARSTMRKRRALASHQVRPVGGHAIRHGRIKNNARGQVETELQLQDRAFNPQKLWKMQMKKQAIVAGGLVALGGAAAAAALGITLGIVLPPALATSEAPSMSNAPSTSNVPSMAPSPMVVRGSFTSSPVSQSGYHNPNVGSSYLNPLTGPGNIFEHPIPSYSPVTAAPSANPTNQPTTRSPTDAPTEQSTAMPTSLSPTTSPTTPSPTAKPTSQPTTAAPVTASPSDSPSSSPSMSPSTLPSMVPPVATTLTTVPSKQLSSLSTVEPHSGDPESWKFSADEFDSRPSSADSVDFEDSDEENLFPYPALAPSQTESTLSTMGPYKTLVADPPPEGSENFEFGFSGEEEAPGDQIMADNSLSIPEPVSAVNDTLVSAAAGSEDIDFEDSSWDEEGSPDTDLASTPAPSPQPSTMEPTAGPTAETTTSAPSISPSLIPTQLPSSSETTEPTSSPTVDVTTLGPTATSPETREPTSSPTVDAITPGPSSGPSSPPSETFEEAFELAMDSSKETTGEGSTSQKLEKDSSEETPKVTRGTRPGALMKSGGPGAKTANRGQRFWGQ